MAEDFDEFERWCGALLEAPYCCLWTHYPVVALWNSVQGRPPLAEQPRARPCALRSCSEAPDGNAVRRPIRERMEALKGALVPGPGEPVPVGAMVIDVVAEPAWVTGP